LEAAQETCCQNGLAKEMFEQLEHFIIGINYNPTSSRRKGDLISILHKAQHIFGYLPKELQIWVAKRLNIQHSEVSGVISFYNYFTTTPKGKYNVAICLGTACFVQGADKVLEEFEKQLGIKGGEVTEDMKFSIDVVRCIGACGLAPVLTIGEKVYGKVSHTDVAKILEDYKD
jgi:NADH:ubiquinone oxidoreductase subunit E